MSLSRSLVLLALWCAVGETTVCTAGLEVERVQWGVDGKLREGRFNLITYQLFNNSERAWEGSLRLQPLLALTAVDVPQVYPDLYLEPYGHRQVQFVVFVPSVTTYELRWGRRMDERFVPDDDPPKAKEDAVFQLMALDALSAKGAAVPSYDESLFPTSVAGFDGVSDILLDHVPKWDELRQRTLRDWVWRGGTLHLFEESAGRYPEFPRVLAEFNEPSQDFRVGSGRVVRHALPLAQADRPYVTARIMPQESVELPAQVVTEQWEWNLPSALLSMLRELTRPEHQWGLIYVLAVVYLVAIFPGCYYVATRKADFRWTYAALVVIVVLFSAGFRAIGARGYGEQTVIHSVGLARPVSDGRVDVVQWSNFFVTGGGQFAVRHQAEGVVYGTGQVMEGVRGMASARPWGLLQVDIPSFSGRSIVHTGVARMESPQFVVKEISGGANQPSSLRLQMTNHGKWAGGSIAGVHALTGSGLYLLSHTGNGLYQGTYHQPLASALDHNSWTSAYSPWRNEQPASVETLFEKLRQMMIAYDLGLNSQLRLSQYSYPAGRLRVYVYAEVPAGLQAEVNTRTLQRGRLLYAVDVPLTEPPASPETTEPSEMPSGTP